MFAAKRIAENEAGEFQKAVFKRIFEPTEKFAPSQRRHFAHFAPTGKFAITGKLKNSHLQKNLRLANVGTVLILRRQESLRLAVL
jgi:hypothetical protein